ncbi:CLCN3 [Cordylochernes scorpioides]|uniref:CLCN3 n=1 Tax=Cordylochernes scorpioides TaxID=51811 RepID=A0ABY6KZX3_9ARAC|nr:CLCN3 [Cordylochernes scorpioides]
MLTIQQKENHIEVAKKCLKWWKKTLIGRKKHGFTGMTRKQNANPDFASQKTKVVLVTFFDIKGIVDYEYLEEGQTINKESYLNTRRMARATPGIMRRVRESIRLKRSEMWSSKNWIIHHDNAPPHTATSVLTYLAKHAIQILQQHP